MVPILHKVPIADKLSGLDSHFYKHPYHLLPTLGFKSHTHACTHITALGKLISRIELGPFYFTDVRDILIFTVLTFFKAAFRFPDFKFYISGLYNFLWYISID